MENMSGAPPEDSVKKTKNLDERTSKWGDPEEKVFNPPSFYAIARGIPQHEIEYLMRLYRLDELIKMKNIGQLDLQDRDVRSPSPEPIYDKDGKRLNTTE
jgi:splicing factor 1